MTTGRGDMRGEFRLGAWDMVRSNVLSPAVLAFVLGFVATLVRSDLTFPEALYTSLSIFLLLSIGLRGGVELSHVTFRTFWRPALVTILLGVSVPVWCYAILRRLGKFDIANAAAIAAHYGSVSAVTFATVLTFLDNRRIAYEGFVPTLVAFLEVPAILVALLIARWRLGGEGQPWSATLHELLAGRSVLLLVLFLLEMGMIAAQRLRDLRVAGPFLIGFAVVMPVLHGLLGVTLGRLAGMSLGGCVVLGVLAASSSYIAAPAAVRIALPQANPSYYLTASIGITFPFNLAFGIPLYYAFAQLLTR